MRPTIIVATAAWLLAMSGEGRCGEAAGQAAAPAGIFRANLCRTAEFKTKGVHGAPAVKWRVARGSRVRGGLLVADGIACFASWRELCAVDAETGNVKWSVSPGLDWSCHTAIADGVAYVRRDAERCTKQVVVALDLQTGKEKWRATFDHPTDVGVPAIAGGVLYFGQDVGTFRGALVALDVRTRQIRWTFRTRGGISGCPAIDGGVVYVGTHWGRLYAVEADTGRLKWYARLGDWASTPAIADGVVCIRSGRYLRALDVATGRRKWRFKGEGTSVHSAPAVADGVVYFAGGLSYVAVSTPVMEPGHLFAVDLQTGREVWRFRTGAPVYAAPAVADGTVYFTSWDRHLYAVDAKTGQEKWRFRTGAKEYASPVVADGVVYFGGESGDLLALH